MAIFLWRTFLPPVLLGIVSDVINLIFYVLTFFPEYNDIAILLCDYAKWYYYQTRWFYQFDVNRLCDIPSVFSSLNFSSLNFLELLHFISSPTVSLIFTPSYTYAERATVLTSMDDRSSRYFNATITLRIPVQSIRCVWGNFWNQRFKFFSSILLVLSVDSNLLGRLLN